MLSFHMLKHTPDENTNSEWEKRLENTNEVLTTKNPIASRFILIYNHHKLPLNEFFQQTFVPLLITDTWIKSIAVKFNDLLYSTEFDYPKKTESIFTIDSIKAKLCVVCLQQFHSPNVTNHNRSNIHQFVTSSLWSLTRFFQLPVTCYFLISFKIINC